MRTGVTVHLSPSDRERLQAIVDDRNTSQKHVWRARIVLGTADGLGTVEIMRTAGVSKTVVWRWQARFMEEGVEGLLRDKTRPLGIVRPRHHGQFTPPTSTRRSSSGSVATRAGRSTSRQRAHPGSTL